MRPKLKLCVSTAGIALCAFGASAAQAAGTTQGTDITNTATVNYNISGAAQPAITGSNTFKVDRKVNLTVAEVGNATTAVYAGQAQAVTTFSVTNNSNDVIDIGLSIVQSSGGTAKHGGTDSFDITSANTYVDTNGNGVYDAGTDQQVTYLDELAANAAKTVFIVGDIPSSQANASVANVNLVGTAEASGTAGTQGAVLTNSTGANVNNTVETVLADAAGSAPGDVVYDGKHSAADDYTVNSSNAVTVVKNAYVVSDPTGSANPKMIPGAVVQYCITVSNPTGLGQALTGVTISDPLPSQTTYVANSLMINATSGTPCTGGTAGGSFASNTATWTVGNLATGASATMLFQVTIN